MWSLQRKHHFKHIPVCLVFSENWDLFLFRLRQIPSSHTRLKVLLVKLEQLQGSVPCLLASQLWFLSVQSILLIFPWQFPSWYRDTNQKPTCHNGFSLHLKSSYRLSGPAEDISTTVSLKYTHKLCKPTASRCAVYVNLICIVAGLRLALK